MAFLRLILLSVVVDIEESIIQHFLIAYILKLKIYVKKRTKFS